LDAIPRSDAAIINHQIQALLIVDRGIDGTNIFARGRFAVLAHHRLSNHLRIINQDWNCSFPIGIERLEEILFLRAGGVIAIDAQPVHFAPALDLILATMGTLFSLWQAITQAEHRHKGLDQLTFPLVMAGLL